MHELEADDLAGHDLIIAGVPTWYMGELQDDWDTLCPGLCRVDLSASRVAVFGAGDQSGYPDHFQDAMGRLLDAFVARGARPGLGSTSTEGYAFEGSLAVREGRFCGLAIDEVNQPELTEARIRAWCSQLRRELGQAKVSRPQRAA